MRNERVRISHRVGYRKIGEKFVIFSCISHQIAILNSSAELLCRCMSRWIEIDDLILLLTNDFQIDKKQAAKDVKKFVCEMARLKIVETSNIFFQEQNIEENDNRNGKNLLLEVEKHAIQKIIPFSVTFELTYKCNERCLHCYMMKKNDSLTIDDIKRILIGLKNEGCLFLSLTGGEPLIRSDILEIISFAGINNFVIDILTNGTLINKDIIEVFLQNPVRRIQVSIYGADAKIHDTITRIPGSFNRTIKGIRLLVEAGIKVELAFPLMTLNFGQRYKVKRMAGKLGCLLLPSPIITARNNGETDTWSLRLDDNQLEEFMSDQKLFGLYSGRKPFQEHQFYLGFDDLNEANPCYGGINTCAINPDGKIFPCNQLLFKLGDCQKQSFSNIWLNSLKIKWLRSIKVKDLPQCSSCPLLPYCSRCPGLAYIENEDVLGISPENCRMAKIWFKIQKERRWGNYEERKKKILSADDKKTGLYKKGGYRCHS